MSGMTVLMIEDDAAGVYEIVNDLTSYVNTTGSTSGWIWPKPVQPAVLVHDDLGIDVSFYQPVIDWQKVKASGIKFAFIKSSESTYTDQMFKSHWAGSKVAGIPRGAYHYFRIESDPVVQAQVLYSNAKDAELELVLDIEKQSKVTTASAFSNSVLVCLQELERLSGRKPMVYTGKYIWSELTGSPNWAGDYPLWIAQYPYGNRAPTLAEIQTRSPGLPIGWTSYVYWQVSDKGSVPGIPNAVDIDIKN